MQVAVIAKAPAGTEKSMTTSTGRLSAAAKRNADLADAGDRAGVLPEPRMHRRLERRSDLEIGIGDAQRDEPLPHPPGGAVNGHLDPRHSVLRSARDGEMTNDQ